ncbi:MAG: hypothetical protein KGL39_34780, partial [Patescibacteria group bacterium]|nr:hypothetical protein [Patescibacteria group bacterium]
MAQSQVDILITAQNRTEQAFSQVQEQLGALRGKVDDVSSSMGRLSESHRSLLKEFGTGLVYSVAFGALASIKDGLDELGHSIIENTIQAQTWEFQLTSLGLSATETQGQIQFLTDTALKYSLSLSSLGQNFGRFIATAINSGASLQEADKAFASTAEVFRVLHTSTNGVTRAYIQLSEAMAKNKLGGKQLQAISRDAPVFASDLRKALGEITGSMDDTAVSTNVLIAALDRMADNPHMLEATKGLATSLQGAINNLQTAWFQLTNQSANPQGLNDMISAINSLTASLNNPEFQQGVASLVSGLAHLASGAIKFSGEVAWAFKKMGLSELVEASGQAFTQSGQSAQQKITELFQKNNELRSQLHPKFMGVLPLPLNSTTRNDIMRTIQGNDAEIRKLEEQVANQRVSGGAHGTTPEQLADISDFKPDKSLMAVQVEGVTKYQSAVTQLAHSMEILQQNSANLTKTLNAPFKDKHEVLGYRDALARISAVA